jgi:hypothetical protein
MSGKAGSKTKTLTGLPGSWSDGRKVTLTSGAHLQAQAFIIRARPFVDRILESRDIRMEKDKHGLYSLFLYDKRTGRPAPFTSGDFIEALEPAGANVANIVETAKRTGLGKTRIGKVSVLTDTSKMGCFSFNLPAGPVGDAELGGGGTCPSANIAFLHQPDEIIRFQIAQTNKAHLERGAAALRANRRLPVLKAEDERYLDPPDGLLSYPASIEKYICGSCYALKGAYGNPSMLFCMQVRLRWVEQELAKGTLAKQLARAIRAGQSNAEERLDRIAKKAAKQLASGREHDALFEQAKAYMIPNPRFFRIHDAGDFWKRSYALAWFDVCRELSDISFWAPTRVWMKDILDADALARIPANLALRPSALHFGDLAPSIEPKRTAKGRGYSAGSGSGLPNYDRSAQAWPCPAYLHETEGGGAVYKGYESDESGVVTPKGKLQGGTCARTRVRFTDHGPVLDPSGEHECRACWVFNDHYVTYQEH